MTGGRRVVVTRRPPPIGARLDYAGTACLPESPPDVPAMVGLQLRQALRTVGVTAGLLVGVPVLAMWAPHPWVWVALSVAVQGAWVGLSVLQLRWAERLER
ncbi:hypothetical protein [Nonomuraea gerenzanensis]|uniref:Uncharacterized protein n=1 Tax=Nonomuraea gerenzanensis TaxID=93944 RepID=A0A1M4E710_9ACTN|nr:hypothetical protein [Nonomuraea gerenzanensis]UBU16818.1 hypothetical protein LCN96_17900 [Nonomuraea gerenzanensis]SBO94528.1 hypothetical protein BN4615_P4044 [Nonomuraea gerenzanensis]